VAVHISVVRSGSRKQYEKLLLRKSFRYGSRVRKVTVANVTDWKEEKLAELRELLKQQGRAAYRLREYALDPRIFSLLIEQGCDPWRVSCAMTVKPAA
jgi:hypothetical protein